jgi:DNA polymerase
LVWHAENGIEEVLASSGQTELQKRLMGFLKEQASGPAPASLPTPETKKKTALPSQRAVNSLKSLLPQSKTSKPTCVPHTPLPEFKTLDELKQYIYDFQGCPLKETALNTVFADGNPQSDVMLIGEAPGAEEDKQGKPFVGLSGQLLDKMLASIGLDRQKVYITNIVPWRPPGNRVPSTDEVALCMPFVEQHISLIKPKIIICVGATAVKALLRTTEGITHLRSRWHTWRDKSEKLTIPLRAWFHPAYLLRSPGKKRDAWVDLCLLREYLLKKKTGILHDKFGQNS